MPTVSYVVDGNVFLTGDHPVLDEVIDGDTFSVSFLLQVGSHYLSFTVRCRLFGVNAPELHRGTEREAGEAASEYTEQWLEDADTHWSHNFRVQLHGADNFGRVLITIWRKSDGRCLNDDLVESGHAVYKEYK